MSCFLLWQHIGFTQSCFSALCSRWQDLVLIGDTFLIANMKILIHLVVSEVFIFPLIVLTLFKYPEKP